jgi:tRNA(Ile)-lysidine synthase
MDFKEQFVQHWKNRHFATDSKSFLLAVSGGIDSMAMCHLFLEAGIPFSVAHCNFGLREKESDGDEMAVINWCKEHEVVCYQTRFDTAAVAEETKKSIQETARDLRYEWFEQIRKEHGLVAVATAHHAGDNAETMIMNMCRGTGIAGLHGIPERNGSVIRPLLFATREAIVAYVTEKSISYREDSSNKKDDYLRNAIRHHIMPLMEQYMPGAAIRMRETANRVLEAEILYNKVLEKEKKRLLQQRGQDVYVPINLLVKTKPLHTICYELFKPFDFNAAQTVHILSLLQAETGRYISSATHHIIRNRDFLIVTAVKTEETDFIQVEEPPRTIIAGDRTFKFVFKDQVHDLDSGPDTVYVDASKISFPLVLRRWKEGDYFYPLGMGMKKKKVSRFLIDQKVPLHEKKNIWVLVSDKRIVWIAGKRLDERFKVTPATSSILSIKVT